MVRVLTSLSDSESTTKTSFCCPSSCGRSPATKSVSSLQTDTEPLSFCPGAQTQASITGRA